MLVLAAVLISVLITGVIVVFGLGAMLATIPAVTGLYTSLRGAVP